MAAGENELSILTSKEEVIPDGSRIDSAAHLGVAYDFNPSTYSGEAPCQVVYMYEWQDSIRIMLRHSSGGWVVLKYVHKEENNTLSYPISMDFRYSSTGTYVPESNRTRFTYPYSYLSPTVVTVESQPQQLPIVAQTSTYVEVDGNAGGLTAYLGQVFSNYMELTRFFAGPTTVKPTVSSMTVYYKNTLNFNVIARRRGSTTGKTYKARGLRAGKDSLSESGIETDSKTFNVLLDGREAFIRIEGEGAVPITISALSFEVRYSNSKGVN